MNHTLVRRLPNHIYIDTEIWPSQSIWPPVTLDCRCSVCVCRSPPLAPFSLPFLFRISLLNFFLLLFPVPVPVLVSSPCLWRPLSVSVLRLGNCLLNVSITRLLKHSFLSNWTNRHATPTPRLTTAHSMESLPSDFWYLSSLFFLFFPSLCANKVKYTDSRGIYCLPSIVCRASCLAPLPYHSSLLEPPV